VWTTIASSSAVLWQLRSTGNAQNGLRDLLLHAAVQDGEDGGDETATVFAFSSALSISCQEQTIRRFSDSVQGRLAGVRC